MEDAKFTALMQQEWRDKFADDGTNDWTEKWFVDGLRAAIRNTPAGMVFAAGPVPYDNGEWGSVCIFLQQAENASGGVLFSRTRAVFRPGDTGTFSPQIDAD